MSPPAASRRFRTHLRRLVGQHPSPIEAATGAHGPEVAYEPDLLPPLERMADEGIHVLEEWFRWGEEWSMLLRSYAGLGADSNVLEIGCGQGRIAFPLRYVLWGRGTYDGFDIDRSKIERLQRTFTPAHPRFNFQFADVRNTFYNPGGAVEGHEFRFPYPDDSFDVVFAASVFTHLGPRAAARYFEESARVLRPGGRCVFSFFLLDNYRSGQPRPLGFGRSMFDFEHRHPDWDDRVAIVEPVNPEQMTAYADSLVCEMAGSAGLEPDGDPLTGLWSGGSRTWIAAQDLRVLRHILEAQM